MKRFSVKYANQLGTEKKYDELFAYANAHAEKKADALAFLGLCYDGGYGVEQDREHAVKLFQESSDRGSAIGRFHLAYTYAYGPNEKAGKTKAKELFWSLGSAQAHYFYALLCDDAQKERELKWMFHPLFGYADAYVPAMVKLGDLYKNKKQLEKARKWYKKAAKLNSCYAKYQLAQTYQYYDNTGYKYQYVDENAYIYWLEEAAKHPPETATFHCQEEFCYLNSSRYDAADYAAKAHEKLADYCSKLWLNSSKPLNYEKARFHYETIIKHNCDDYDVLQDLGELYHKGLGGPVDKERAFSLFSQSLKQIEAETEVHKSYWVQALTYIGHAYLVGEGTEQDAAKAFDYLNRAIAVDMDTFRGQGAFYYVGYCHYFGYGTEQNTAEAAKYWKQGAENSCALSKIALGYLYERGIGVEQDFSAANELYTDGLAYFYLPTVLSGRLEDCDDEKKRSLEVVNALALRDCFVEIEMKSLQETNEEIKQEIQALEKRCLELGPEVTSARENAIMQSELNKEKAAVVAKTLKVH